MSRPSAEYLSYDLWWKNAVVYCLDVETYLDSNGSGTGDIRGLTHRVDYLANLGVDCLWLMPFYPTPNRDDGYDVTDYFGVDPRLGDLGDFTAFMRAARERGIRVVVDLVVNHTSAEHPWFEQARRGPESPFHDFYVWRDEPPQDWEETLIFPGEQVENWTYDDEAGRYYLHHYYRHQPDLNPNNPVVRQEMMRIMSYWIELGVSGFRVDSAPYLIEMRGIEEQLELTPHEFLRDLAEYLERRRGDAIMLGEVNLPPDEASEFFGDGTELRMLLNFHVNQHLVLALARQSAQPLRSALESLPPIPDVCQWANFLTNHDELTLDQLTAAERDEVFAAFAPDDDMRLYGRGIRRRLPPMLEDDAARLRLAYSALFSLPGTPVLFYGEEIGMGENLALPGRHAVRSAMQWSPDGSGGFSPRSPHDLHRPPPEGPFGPAEVNVVEQAHRPDSMFRWMQQLIRRRREIPEFGFGHHSLLDLGSPAVLAIRFEHAGRSVIAVHNFSAKPVEVDLSAALDEATPTVLWSNESIADSPPDPELVLAPYGYRWLRSGGDSWVL